MEVEIYWPYIFVILFWLVRKGLNCVIEAQKRGFLWIINGIVSNYRMRCRKRLDLGQKVAHNFENFLISQNQFFKRFGLIVWGLPNMVTPHIWITQDVNRFSSWSLLDTGNFLKKKTLLLNFKFFWNVFPTIFLNWWKIITLIAIEIQILKSQK